MSCPTTVAGWLVGMPVPQLQTLLAQLQAAYATTLTGKNAQIVSYGQGDGTKSVTYNRVDAISLRVHIGEVQAALGITPRRRAIVPRWS